MKIKILSEDIINKIAAGEVVERPASVVKELVENSIDAGATKIDVEVRAGGKTLVRVTDNGCGMDKEDCLLAFERHATSKIETLDDLGKISTLGFRGEALPSIASVSKVELITRTNQMDSAIRIRIEGGKLMEIKETGAPLGTMVSVQNLFYNIPARRKFLKSNTTELGHIINTISNYIIVYTDCGFSLTHNGEPIIEIFPRDSLLDRIRILYGNEIAEEVVEMDYKKDGLKVSGFVGKPQLTYPTRSNQFIFVNRRPIVSRTISYAIYEAYANLIPKGRFPPVFIFLEIPPESIDVNVHPTKKEVRFGDDRFVQAIVREGILDALKIKESVPVSKPDSCSLVEPTYTPAYKILDSWGVSEGTEAGSIDKVLQMNNAYIIHEVEDGFEIMDQHAVHERILYEKIKSAFEKKTPQGQRLLIPINIELTPEEEELIKKELPFFNELGFNIEEFGSHSFIVDTIPAIMDKVDIAMFIKDSISQIREFQKVGSHRDIKDGIIKLMACRSAIRQGDPLDNIEMQRLLKDWRGLKLPYTCPHGRPAVIKITMEELDKKFSR